MNIPILLNAKYERKHVRALATLSTCEVTLMEIFVFYRVSISPPETDVFKDFSFLNNPENEADNDVIMSENDAPELGDKSNTRTVIAIFLTIFNMTCCFIYCCWTTLGSGPLLLVSFHLSRWGGHLLISKIFALFQNENQKVVKMLHLYDTLLR